MKICGYAVPWGTVAPTGQAKHEIQMLLGLARRPGVDLTILSSRTDLDGDGRIADGSPLSGLPVRGYPLPGRWMHGCWRWFRGPTAERWCGDVDWVYSPLEVFVPHKDGRSACTIHCADWFDPEVPWYGSAATARERRRMARVFRAILDRSRVVLTVSEFLRQRLCALLGAAPERVAVVGNGVEDAFFQAGARDESAEADLEADGGPPRLLAVGALNARKGGADLLALAAELERRRRPVRITVAGGRHGDPDLVRRAAGLANVEVLDYVGGEALVRLMRRSRVMLVLSRYESFGIPAAEAMAAGVPLVAGRRAALPEVVGEGGILVDPEAGAEVADRVEALLDDPGLRRRQVARGRAWAERFRWESCVDRLVGVLRACA